MSICPEASALGQKQHFNCSTLIKMHYNCPHLKVGNGLVAGEVPVHLQSTAEEPWSQGTEPPKCSERLSSATCSLLRLSSTDACVHCMLIWTACKQNRPVQSVKTVAFLLWDWSRGLICFHSGGGKRSRWSELRLCCVRVWTLREIQHLNININ